MDICATLSSLQQQINSISLQLASIGGSGGAVSSVAGKVGAVSLNKFDVGLGNVDNTADAAKPLSTADVTALAAKADATLTINGYALSANVNLSPQDLGFAVSYPLAANLSLFNNDAGYITASSPALSGVPTAPTASNGTATTQIATTAFVQNAVSLSGGSGSITSVFARTGAIVATGSDYSAFYYPLSSNPSGYLTSVDLYYDSTYFNGNLTSSSPLVLATSGVTPGSYTNSNLTVDSVGRITTISNGIGPGFGPATNNTWTGTNMYAPTLTGSSGIFRNITLAATVNLSGTATYTSFLVSPYQQTLGSGTNYLLDLGTNSATNATGTHSSVFSVDSSGNLVSIGKGSFITTVANQLVVGYDSTHYISFNTTSAGSLSIIPNQTSQTLTVNSFSQVSAGSVIANGALQTTATGTNANFFVSGNTSVGAGGLSVNTTTIPSTAFAGASTVSFRTLMRGQTSTVLGVGDSYASFLQGIQGIATAASGTHALLAQHVINPLTITAGASTITNTASLYVNGVSTATVAGKNYTAWFSGGVMKNTGGREFGPTLVADANYTMVQTDAFIIYTSLSTTSKTITPLITMTNQEVVVKDESGNASSSIKILFGTASFTLDGVTGPADLIIAGYGAKTIYTRNGTNWFTK